MARGRKPLGLGAVGKVSVSLVRPGVWEALGRVRDSSGRTVRVRARGGSQAAARRALHEKVLARVGDSGSGDLSSDSTVEALAGFWFEGLEVSMNTRRVYRSSLDLYVLPALGLLRVRELSTPRIESFLRGLDGVGKRKTARAVLSGMCSLAVRWGLLSHNPVRETTPARSRRELVRAMSVEEVQRLRVAVGAYAGGNKTGQPRALWLPNVVDFMLGTGCRIGEVLALRWCDVEGLGEVDGVGGVVPVVATVSGTLVFENGRGCYRQDFTKTDSSMRSLVLPPLAVAALESQRDVNGAGLTQWCFPASTSNPISLAAAQRALRAARPKELDWVHFHVLRKTVATLIAASGGLEAAKLQLGHSDVAVTQRHYVQRPDVVSAGVVLDYGSS